MLLKLENGKWKGEQLDYKTETLLDSKEKYLVAIDQMFDYNVQLFEDYPNLKIEEYDNEKKIKVRWGQYYDVEQLYEHAILHVLRHRRQIERSLQLIKKSTEVKP